MGYENSKEYRLEYRIVLCCFSWQPIVGVDPMRCDAIRSDAIRSDPKTLESYYSAMRTYDAT